VIVDIVNALTTKAETERMDIDRDVTAKAGADKNGGNVDPAAQSPGPYQSDIKRLNELQEAIATADFRHWAALAMDQNVADQVEKVQADLQASAEKALRFQQRRYNLWALQQIHVAEDAPNWPERLGQIDSRFLHPSVAALYSMVNDSLVKGLDDHAQRPAALRRLINQDKVHLERF